MLAKLAKTPGNSGIGGNPYLTQSGIQTKHWGRGLAKLGRPPKFSGAFDSIGDSAGTVTYQGTGPWYTKGCSKSGRIVCRTYNQGGWTAYDWVAGRRYDHLAINPDVITLLFCENALDDGDDMAANNAAMITLIEDAIAAGVQVIILPFPTPSTDSLVDNADQAQIYIDFIHQMAATYPQVVVGPDFYSLWDASELATYTWDNVHPNYAGVSLMAETFAAWIEPYVQNIQTITNWIANASGTFAINDLSFTSAIGATGYGSPVGTYTQASSTTPGNGLTTNGVQITKTGGQAVRAYRRETAVSTIAAEEWYLVSYKIKLNNLGGDSWLYSTYYFFGSGPDVVGIINAGQMDTDGFYTFSVITKGNAGQTRLGLDIHLRVALIAGTTSTGIVTMSECAAVRLSTSGTSWNMP